MKHKWYVNIFQSDPTNVILNALNVNHFAKKKKKFIALKYKLKRNKGVKRESSTFYITFVSHSLNISPCPFCDTKH